MQESIPPSALERVPTGSPLSPLPLASRVFLVLGSLGMAAAVVLGALGAHLLEARLTAPRLAVYEIALHYQIIHSLGLLAIGLVTPRLSSRGCIRWAGGLMTAGIVVFCGSLYGLSLTGWPVLGRVTPFGGTAFILAWLLLALAVLKS
ncbi:MAG: DUF423 domain-containing protein [Betaproteobacteria bacterium]|nr:DUF423 domain-containing protein [Betaproteobacteria bacterium]